MISRSRSARDRFGAEPSCWSRAGSFHRSSRGYGHDFPGHIDELVLGEAAVVEDVVVGFEDTVGEPVVAHELPDVFYGVEFG